MSNTNENPELEQNTQDLRKDDLGAAANKSPFMAQPPRSGAPPIPGVAPLTAEDVIRMGEDIRKNLEEQIRVARFNADLPNQVLPKSAAPILDFSQLSMADVYDLDVPIEAKPFMSADNLKVNLADTNYEARWINKNPQNLGDKISKGFTYIEPNDLVPGDNEAIQTSLDAEGHYSIHDVVAMKIDKATYYRALRAAHLRAMSTTNQTSSRKKAAAEANNFMNRSSARGEFQQAAEQGKMTFYDPGVQI